MKSYRVPVLPFLHAFLMLIVIRLRQVFGAELRELSQYIHCVVKVILRHVLEENFEINAFWVKHFLLTIDTLLDESISACFCS